MTDTVKKATQAANNQAGAAAATDKAEETCPCELVLEIWRKREWNKQPASVSANVQQGGTIGDFELRKSGEAKPLVTGVILEAAGPSSKVQGSDARVMPGTYRMIKNPGSKGPYRIVQLTQNDAVSYFGTRGAVNIHGGNNPVDLEGCLLPGGASAVNNVTEKAVGKAKPAVSQYPSISSSQPKLAEIKQVIGDYGVLESKTTYDGSATYNTSHYKNVTVIIHEIVPAAAP